MPVADGEGVGSEIPFLTSMGSFSPLCTAPGLEGASGAPGADSACLQRVWSLLKDPVRNCSQNKQPQEA